MNWNSLFGAGFVQDPFRLSPSLTVTLGFRGEFTSGWNEAHGRAANYTFYTNVISTIHASAIRYSRKTTQYFYRNRGWQSLGVR